MLKPETVRHCYLAAKAMRLEQLLVVEVVRLPVMCCLASQLNVANHLTDDAAGSVDLD